MSSDLSSDLTSDLSVIVSIPATQDPRSKISRKLFILSFLRHEFRLEFRLDSRLECHSLDSCYPRSKIQDFQKAFLGNLGINPRSKIQDFQKTFLGCTCRILDAPKIQDSQTIFLGCRLEILDAPKIQDPRFPEIFSWMQAGNLGCTQDPRSKISRKLFLDALAESWMHPRSWILGLSQDFQDFQEKFSGNLGSWILGASKISSLHPRKIFWESWILDLRWQALRLEFRLKFRLEISVHMCRQKLSDKQCPCASV